MMLVKYVTIRGYEVENTFETLGVLALQPQRAPRLTSEFHEFITTMRRGTLGVISMKYKQPCLVIRRRHIPTQQPRRSPRSLVKTHFITGFQQQRVSKVLLLPSHYSHD